MLKVEDAGRPENAGIRSDASLSQTQSDNPDQPTKRSLAAKVRNIWQRYGSFCQDTVVQITYFIPEVIVAMDLQRKYVGEVSQCTVPNWNALKGAAIEYKNVRAGKPEYAAFSADFFLKACSPFWPDGNRVCWDIFVAAIFFHQVTFFCINVFKVSSILPVSKQHLFSFGLWLQL